VTQAFSSTEEPAAGIDRTRCGPHRARRQVVGGGGEINKAVRLRELALRRKESRWPGYNCVGDYHGGIYECEHVSPYTIGAGSVDADVMILLQDWASDDVLSGPVLHERCTVGHDPRRATNRRLRELLWRHFGLELAGTYATNVFPFVKLGSMGAKIRPGDLVRAAREFALPQIEIVAPRIAVCLGKAAFNAVASAAGHRAADRLADALACPFDIGESEVWCQRHPGRNSVARVKAEWARMEVSAGHRTGHARGQLP
jgi:restriction system protein